MQYLVHHMLLESAARRPGHVAFIDDQHRLDYRTAVRKVTSIARQLQGLGICRGDRVAIYLKPGVNLPLAILGVSMAGAVFVPVHHGQFPDQVSHILNDSGAAALIIDGQRLQRIAPVLGKTPSLRFAVASDPKVDQVDGLPVYDLSLIHI